MVTVGNFGVDGNAAEGEAACRGGADGTLGGSACNAYSNKFTGGWSTGNAEQAGYTNYEYGFWTKDAVGDFTVYVRPSHIEAEPHPMLSCQPRPRR